MDIKIIVIIIQVIVILSLVAVITLFIRLNNAIRLEKRIAKYSIKYKKGKKNVSLYGKIIKGYSLFIKKQRKKIKGLMPRLVRKYDEYASSENVKGVDLVTNKFVLGFIFCLFTIIVRGLQGHIVSFIQIVIGFLFGFMAMDIYIFINKKLNKKRIEEDMLKAIIIMNNGFKSGMSTMQAIEMASKKLKGPIGNEFRLIYEEVKYGLAIDTVFDRFSKRVNLEEAEYLSSSLTILNRTGGNIIAVFDSIEKTLFDKMKLKEELKQSTAVSKLVVKVLIAVPIIFVLLIYLYNPEYFEPFFSSSIGIVLLVIIFIMFILYAFFLDRIVKVDY